MNGPEEPWSSTFGNAVGCLVVAILFGLILIVLTSTSGYAVQFR